MRNKDYLQWKYARNYQIANNKCYKCKTELDYIIQTIRIGKQIVENAKVLTCPNCSQIKWNDPCHSAAEKILKVLRIIQNVDEQEIDRL